MYDCVFCDMPLPGGFKPESGETFQTKDLGQMMGSYRITAEGQLVREGGADGIAYGPAIDCVPGAVNFHGLIRFYTYDSNDKWHEFVAKFDDGSCVEIREASDDEHWHP